jgi:signal transduction histidine kinase
MAPRPACGLYDPQTLLNSQPVIVTVIDPSSHKVQFQNETGLKKLGNISGAACHEKIAGSASPCAFCKMPEAVQTGQMAMNEVPMPNNQFLLVQWSKTETSDGRTHVIETITDVTERKRLEEAAKRAEKMQALSRFAGGMAHDLNNLLTVIQGASDLALHQNQQEPVRALLGQIQDAVGRAASLGRHLVAFSNCQVVQPAVLNPNIVLTDLEPKVCALVGDAITVEASLTSDAGSILADRAQLEEIVMALVRNAREAMTKGGKLVLSSSVRQLDEETARQHNVKPGAYVLIGVQDTGCGIDPQVQAHLFEPFVARKQFETGRGLGLPSVYGMVRHGGGFIECASRVGVGTLFTVGLPQSQRMQPAKPLVQKGTHERGQETILLVEDDESVRTAVKAMLKNAQFKVLEASDGTEALQLLERQAVPPQLVLTDVMTPRMSGPQLGQQLAAAAPNLKMLYMSGYPDEAVKQTDGKPVDFIAKPFSATDLIAKVRQTLAA